MRFIPLLTFALLACNSGSSSTNPAASSAPTSSGSAAPSATATAAPQAAAPPDDLGVAELQKTLKCGADAKTGACSILSKFAECKPWTATVPSGDGRWLGRATVLADGKGTESYMLLRLKAVPAADVGPGQLPAKIALAELTKEDGAAFSQADRALRAFDRGDVPPRSSPTIEHIKKRETWPDAYAVRTVGGHVYVIAQGGTFICQGPKQQLLLVQRAATRAGSGDGIYAEFWAASW